MSRRLLLIPLLSLPGPLLQAQWYQEPSPTTGNLWAVRFASESVGWMKGSDHHQSSDSAYIFKTTDGGATWIIQETWVGSSYGPLTIVDDLTVIYSRSLSGVGNVELRKTSDGGVTWETVDKSLDGFYEDIEFVDSLIGFSVGGAYNGSDYDGFVHKTTDGGATWVEISLVPGEDLTGVSFLNPQNGWISAYWNEVYRTSDGGFTWINDTVYAPPNTPTRDVQFTTPDSGWTVGGIGGDLTISRTTDGGTTWQYYESPLCGSSLRELQMLNSHTGWVAGSNNCEPYLARTTDGGVIWETQATSPNGFESISMVNESYGWACGGFGNLWHTSNGGVTWVNEEVGMPNRWYLNQNYPNPFNPATNIEFGIRKAGSVMLMVFDLLGREIAVIVDEQLAPGTYQRQWDATGQPSGVYYYRLQTEAFIATRKLLLLR